MDTTQFIALCDGVPAEVYRKMVSVKEKHELVKKWQ